MAEVADSLSYHFCARSQKGLRCSHRPSLSQPPPKAEVTRRQGTERTTAWCCQLRTHGCRERRLLET
eukprot:5962483-Alexandrium_andersonii.AAC.1